jgi:23S rRNA (cytidine2498-2'-O)-methyltransferase
LDAGASPGGWTWALAQLGAEVIAVDKAPLEDRVRSLAGVNFIRRDAFTLGPGDTGPLDWLFCDLIAYPERLWSWLERWLAPGLCGNFVCTIKMQGPAGEPARRGDLRSAEQGFAVARRLARIPGSRVVHLYHNKHELTWIKTAGLGKGEERL